MALGIAGDPKRLADAARTDRTIAHTGHDGGIVGGFTLQMPVKGHAAMPSGTMHSGTRGRAGRR